MDLDGDKYGCRQANNSPCHFKDVIGNCVHYYSSWGIQFHLTNIVSLLRVPVPKKSFAPFFPLAPLFRPSVAHIQSNLCRTYLAQYRLGLICYSSNQVYG